LAAEDGLPTDRVVAGRYRLESSLGRGGMGVVWQAVDTLIERAVAIKELRAPDGATDAERAAFVERALREARHAGQLNHPNVVGVHDVVSPTGADDAVYIVMELVRAPSLADLLDRHGPLPAARAAAVGLGILDALDAAHARGIVHRDVKPANVLVGDGDRVKLTDFGIALAAADNRLTRSGVIGTQAYLAPECFDAREAGPAADLWALGATLFHAVAGRAPFDRDTTTATLRAILFEDVPAPPGEPGLAQAITGLLTRPVDQRLSSAAVRQLLQPVAAAGVTPAPVDNPDQAPWEAHATTLHHVAPVAPPPPPTTAPAQFSGAPTQPPGYYPPSAPPPMPGPVAQPWGGPPPQQRRRAPWLIAAVVLIAGAVALVLVLTLAGGGDDNQQAGGTGPGGGTTVSGVPPKGTPAREALDTAGRFFLHASVGNYASALDLSVGSAHLAVQSAQAGHKLMNGGEGDFAIIDLKPQTVEITGARARVTVTFEFATAPSADALFQLEKSAGSWKVSRLPFQMLRS
jgi:hypothetical protein